MFKPRARKKATSSISTTKSSSSSTSIPSKKGSYNDDNDDDDDKQIDNDEDDDDNKQRRRKKQNNKRKSRDDDDDDDDTKDKKTLKKSKKKKKQRAELLSFDVSNDDNDDDDSSSSTSSCSDDGKRKKKKKKKNKKMKEKKKKSKKSSRSDGGFVGGYGGAHVMEDSDSDKDKNDPTTCSGAGAASTSSGLYGKEALESLKKEQKRNIVENIDTADKTKIGDGTTSLTVDGTKTGTEEVNNDNGGVRETNDGGKKESNGVTTDNNNNNEEDDEEEVVIMPSGKNHDDHEENFISLTYHNNESNDDMKKDTIITGDDATSLADKEPHSTLELMAQNESKTNNDSSNNDDDDDSWHDQISQRAGIAPTTPTPPPSSTQQPPPLSQMTTILTKTLSTIQTSLALALAERKKREIDIITIEQDLLPLDEAIDAAVKNRDCHERLRSDLLPLVATLRKIHVKETLVTKALEELYEYYTYGGKGRDYGEEQEWRRDILDFWNGHDRKNDDDGEVEKDEFGRDLKSMKRMDWQKRVSRRRRRRLENGNNDNDNDVAGTARSLAYHSDHESTTDKDRALLLEKRIALRRAMRAARRYYYYNKSNSTTTSEEEEEDGEVKNVISRLHHLIRSWRDADEFKFPKRRREFEECFATESFAELLGRVLMMDVCECLDLMGLSSDNEKEEKKEVANDEETTTRNDYEEIKTTNNDDENNNPTFVTNITHLPSFPHLLNDRTSLTRVISKVIHPHLKKILQKGYDPFSTRQTKSLSTFYSSLVPYLSDSGCKKVEGWIVNCLKRCVTDVAVVYPPEGWKGRTMVTNDDDDDDDEMEMEFQVNVYLAMQVYKYVKLLRHVVIYWYPPFSKVTDDCRAWVFDTLVSQRILPSLQFLGDDDNDQGNSDEDVKKSSVKAVLMEVRDILRDNSDWWEVMVKGTDVMTLPRGVVELRNALKRYDL